MVVLSVWTEKPFVRITHIHTNHRIIKNGGGRLNGDGRLLEKYGSKAHAAVLTTIGVTQAESVTVSCIYQS